MKKLFLACVLLFAFGLPIGADDLEFRLIEQESVGMTCGEMFRVTYNLTTNNPAIPPASGYSIVVYMAIFSMLNNEYGGCS